MTAASDPPTSRGVNWSVKSCRESTRLILVKNESEFKHQVSGDIDEPAVVPETMSQSKAKGDQADQVTSAAHVLISMSSAYSPPLVWYLSPLVWFANKVTYVKHDDDLEFLLKKGQAAGKLHAPDWTYRQQKAQRMQKPGQHGSRVNAIKGKRAPLETKKIIVNWGNIKKGKRSKRVRNRNPMSTLL
ncbi:hypothetical protein Hanom_Chr02g00126891 [Helianthus anomalus]